MTDRPHGAKYWKKLANKKVRKNKCQRCGGTLSEIREHNGRRYRHCYACHFEFEEK